jgi:hypothetical protein
LQPVSAQQFLRSFENPKIGLSISYPSNWEVCRFDDPTAGGGFVEFCDPERVSMDLSIDIIAPITTSPEDYTAMLIQEFESDAREHGRNLQLIGQGSMTVAGKEAYGFTTLLGQTKNTYIYIDVGNTRYNFQFGQNEPTYSEVLIPIIEQIMNSAELTGISDDQSDKLTLNGDGVPFDNSDRGTSTGLPPTSEGNKNNQPLGSMAQESKQQPCTAFTIGDGSCSIKKICPSGCILQQPIIIDISNESHAGFMIAPAGSEITSEGDFKMDGPIHGEKVGQYMVMTKK